MKSPHESKDEENLIKTKRPTSANTTCYTYKSERVLQIACSNIAEVGSAIPNFQVTSISRH